MRALTLVISGLLITACDGRDADDRMANTDATTMPGAGTTMGEPGTDAAQPTTADQYVSRAAMSDMYEIEAGRLALRNAQSTETRAFAQMMVDDHTKSSQDMKAALDRSDRDLRTPASLDGEHQRKLDSLRNLDRAEFDREYMNQQMQAHRDALALHRAYAANGDDAELRQFAQQVIPVILRHQERLDGQMGNTAGTGTTAPQPGATATAAPSAN